MPQTQQVSCPRCRQPVPVNVEQLFDATSDPGAKQRLLGGVSNFVRCPYCGYEGRLPTPIVYHDNEKELLLTFFPPELGLPLNEQERVVGPLIKQVTDRLPAEKRKAYLLSPKPNLTFESMIELILGKDGITPEMIKAQQERVHLVDRLLQASSAEVRSEIIRQNETLFDDQFFALFSRLAQSAASAQPQLAEALSAVQEQLLKETEFGRGLAESVGEMEAAAKSLQEAGKGLTREKLLDLVIASPNDARVRAYVSLARGGMDYAFFQTLTERIEKASGEEKTKLEAVREKMMDYTNEMDRQLEARYKQAQQFIESLLQQDDIAAATQANLQNFGHRPANAAAGFREERLCHDGQTAKDDRGIAAGQRLARSGIYRTTARGSRRGRGGEDARRQRGHGQRSIPRSVERPGRAGRAAGRG